MKLRRLARILVPATLLLAWLIAAAIGGPYFGRVSDVSSNDQAQFLPASADATRVNERFTDFVGSETVPAVVIITSPSAISDPAAAQGAVDAIEELPDVTGASPLLPSQDGQALQAFVAISSDGEVADTVSAARALLAELLPGDLKGHVTGPAGFSADLAAAFGGIDGLLLIVALVAVLIILLLVYRAVALPLVVLATSLCALCVALLSNWWLAKAGLVTLTGQTQGILFILVIGAATDYALLYTARYAEELRRRESTLEATKAAWKASLEPILASGGTVIAGLLCLLLSDLGSNRSLGPVAAIGIGFAMLSAFTLLPAALYLLGRAAYWPRRPVFDENHVGLSATGSYASIGHAVARRPRAVWVACVVLLLAGAACVPMLKADGVPTSEFVLGASDARDGQAALERHYPGGTGSPANVLADEEQLESVANLLLTADGVSAVSVVAHTPAGSAPWSADGLVGFGGPGAPAPEPVISEGQVLIQATLSDAADSAAAEETVRQLRTALAGRALIGGVTAVAVDTQDTAIRDRNAIIPVVLVVIFVILCLLLRSVLAPLLLILTTVLSFGTALGTAALVFNHVLRLPGADASVPLYGFVFLVALGIDYNIFLMTRVREEAIKRGTREGILTGLAVTGGVITSAGIVLAATFAALAVIPILFLLQLAFIVSFGVLLDTFLVRTLLVPALGLDLGPVLWWPAKLEADRIRDA